MAHENLSDLGWIWKHTDLIPPIEIDCSKWVDTSGGGWTVGRFVQHSDKGLINIDCSEWVDTSSGNWTVGRFVISRSNHSVIEANSSLPASPTIWLELTVSFELNTPREKMMAFAARLVQLTKELSPDLGLTCDYQRTWLTTDGDVVVALAPALEERAKECLVALATQLRAAIVPEHGMKKVHVQVVA